MASRRGIRRRGCEHKRVYSSLEEAVLVIRKLLRQGEHNLNAYRCKFNRSHYHIGHMPRGVRQSIADRRGREL